MTTDSTHKDATELRRERYRRAAELLRQWGLEDREYDERVGAILNEELKKGLCPPMRSGRRNNAVAKCLLQSSLCELCVLSVSNLLSLARLVFKHPPTATTPPYILPSFKKALALAAHRILVSCSRSSSVR